MNTDTTKIMLCGGCNPHKYQDEQYGQNMRIYNRTMESDGKIYKCTICGNKKGYNLTDEESKKLKKGLK